MSIQSVSFYQQDQTYWQQANAEDQATSAGNALITEMGTAETNLARGLASIANKTALNRVNSALSAAVQSLLQSQAGGSTPSSPGSSSGSNASNSSASGSTATSAAPATAVGTTILTTGTSLSTLGILAGGRFYVTAGSNTTTYTSTGSDTVGDLINALNIDLSTNAQVTASLNAKGQLVITSRNDSDTIAIGGSGTDAAVLGFGVGHTTFTPTKPSSSSAATSSTGSSTSSSTSSNASTSSASSSAAATSTSKSKKSISSNSASLTQNFTTAASILSADGVSGSLVDMLA